MTAIKGGPCEKNGKLRGGHAIFKFLIASKLPIASQHASIEERKQ